MKYTIELTEKQANQINDIMIDINASWGYPSIPKLKLNTPIPMKESYAYKKGFEDGKADATDTDMIGELKQVEYIRGLEDARQTLLNLLEIPSGEWGNIFDHDSYYIEAIFKHYSVSEIANRIKSYDEKKKAEEEIKVGDEVKSICGGLVGVVTRVNQSTGRFRILFSDGSGGMTEIFPEDYEKTGRHFVQIEEVLEKLRGEE